MRRSAAVLALLALLALPAVAGKETAAPRASRGFDHEAHASALRGRTGGTEGCAGKCHRSQLDGSWVHQRKQEHARCFEGCHTFTTDCGTLASGTGRVCLTCHTNLKERCLPAGASNPPPGPRTPARYSHRVHIRPGANGRQCEACHGSFGDRATARRGAAAIGDRATAGRGAPAIGHRDCGGCHEKQAQPRMTQCQSCHAAAGVGGGAAGSAAPGGAAAGSAAPGRAANPYAVTGAFSHQRHAAERRVGAAGRDCLICHANIASAADDRAIPMPTMRGCLERCHDGAKAFSAVGATCTRCHKGSGAETQPGAARFSHAAHGKRGVDLADCTACHALDADFRVAPPTRGKDHRPCATAGCHVDDFLTRGRPLCSVCHEGSAPWLRQDARTRRRADSEFGSDFSHRGHLGQRAADNDACRPCHGDRLAGRPPPAGHEACAPCHARTAQPAMERCGGCHAAGTGASAAPAASPWSVAARFRHETHAADPRRGSSGGTRCVECHAAVPAATRLAQIARPTMKSCAACHDGVSAFKTTGFGCARCHGAAAEQPGGARR